MNLFEKPKGVQTRWTSFENLTGEREQAALTNMGAKGAAFDTIPAGASRTLLDVEGCGTVHRIWITIDNREPEMLRGLRLEMFWDGCAKPAVSTPFGDFFGIGLGHRTAFECALFSDPEGRSFNCFIPMPFRTGARIVVTNDSDKPLHHIFYDINFTLQESHSAETLYFHAHWRRESPNELGKDFAILPHVSGSGRFLGSNVGVIVNPDYEGAWWGEGEVKVRFGNDTRPTLCGSGTEDYIGTGWGQGQYTHRTQGCPLADSATGRYCFYRYHVDDPVYFDDGCEVTIQTIGGTGVKKVISLIDRGVPAIPVSIDLGANGGFFGLFEPGAPDLRDPKMQEGWCNFWRQEDWSSTAYFYLDRPESNLPPLEPIESRVTHLAQWRSA